METYLTLFFAADEEVNLAQRFCIDLTNCDVGGRGLWVPVFMVVGHGRGPSPWMADHN